MRCTKPGIECSGLTVYFLYLPETIRRHSFKSGLRVGFVSGMSGLSTFFSILSNIFPCASCLNKGNNPDIPDIPDVNSGVVPEK